MKRRTLSAASFIAVTLALSLACSQPAPEAPSQIDEAAPAPGLPSWNDGPTKNAIVDFVARVTDPSGADFVPAAERIATFDNDGTLWSEKPLYFQLYFAIDRVKELASEHPEWQDKQPFKGVLEGDMEAVAAGGKAGLLELVMATHTGMTTDEFQAIAKSWLASARHPERDRPYTELVFQPMLELLEYLRAHGFKTYITSAGGIDLMRAWTEEVYGIPPEQVIGSSVKVELAERDGEPVLMRLPEIGFLDDKEGKPVAIHQFIGRRPIASFGNSDGDFQMLEWATSGDRPGLGVLIHHTDDEREWAYDRDSHVGRLDRGLDEAAERGWILVDMKNDWSTVHPEPAAN